MLPRQLPLAQMQSTWGQALDPVIASPILQGHLIEGIKLINGVTVINHRLDRKLVGWVLVGIDGAATVYDNQATNQMPQLTLSLTSNAAVTISLWVF